jgi:hypothetical protein
VELIAGEEGGEREERREEEEKKGMCMPVRPLSLCLFSAW